MLTDDVVGDDRRAGLGITDVGKDAVLRSAKVVLSHDARIDADVVAVRGDRLALTRQHWTGTNAEGGTYETHTLHLAEIDSDGRMSAFIYFDDDDLDAAFDELDDRYEAGEARDRGVREEFRLARELLQAINERDWPAAEQMLAEDLVFVNHSRASFGEVDRAGWVAYQVSTSELAPDMRTMYVEFHRIGPRGGVAHVRNVGGGLAGGETELESIVVAIGDAEHYSRFELFPLAQLGEALHRFDELTAER
jgi:hypothetical protein